jgi:hydrogenase/urease accessory protein HupE
MSQDLLQFICPLLLTRSRYFVHEQYAGISAFLNYPATEAERNAKMFAIGVLVPLSTGRLGKSWRHAPKLKELTQFVSPDTRRMGIPTDTDA